MGRTCIICKAKSLALSYHRFPINQDVRQKCIEACNVSPANVNNGSVICSQHFQETDYDTFFPLAKLKSGVVPSVGLGERKIEPQASSTDMYNEKVQVAILSVPKNVDCNIQHKNKKTDGPQPSTSSYQSELLPEGAEISSIIQSESQGTICRTPEKNVRYVGDLQESDFRTPRRAKRHLELVRKTLDTKTNTIKKLRIEKSRLKHKLNSLKEVLETLYEKKMISENAMQMLQENTPDTLKLLLDRQLQAKAAKYNPELRAFALTLNFYSPRGYNFLRERVKNLLPHPETIRKWYKVVNGEPGFTNQAFEAIKIKCQEKPVYVSLTLDEMSIREHVDYTPTKVYGFVDMGSNLNGNGDHQTKARSVLVIMAVSLTDHWKVPLGYFLINSLTGPEHANIVKLCLELLHETGAQCTSITFDGAPVNVSMCIKLGCNLTLDDDTFAPWFKHPITGQIIYVFYDPVHMIKLIRNTFGERDDLHSPSGEIKFSLIKNLQIIEKQHSLRAATKLTKRHIFFSNEKMKVRLAVQVLSNSVSSALLFCKSIGIGTFENCEATAEFCKNMNDAFDILNCKNFCSTSEFCKPLRAETKDLLFSKINYLINYINSLTNSLDQQVVNSNRKTGFMGLIICLTNVKRLYLEYIECNKLKFILTYKLNQDHLEMFFASIRSRGGYNNNPSALQFRTAYKKLLVKRFIKAEGNISMIDATTILSIGSSSSPVIADSIVDLDEPMLHDHDYFNYEQLNLFTDNVVVYIAGFIVKKIEKIVSCEVCRLMLRSPCIQESNQFNLINIKNRGNLVIPHDDVIKICKSMESLIRQYKPLLLKPNFNVFIINKMMLENLNPFNNTLMGTHLLNQDILDNHRIQLVKLIANMYIKIITYHTIKCENEKLSIRHKLSKIVTFSNQ